MPATQTCAAGRQCAPEVQLCASQAHSLQPCGIAAPPAALDNIYKTERGPKRRPPQRGRARPADNEEPCSNKQATQMPDSPIEAAISPTALPPCTLGTFIGKIFNVLAGQDRTGARRVTLARSAALTLEKVMSSRSVGIGLMLRTCALLLCSMASHAYAGEGNDQDSVAKARIDAALTALRAMPPLESGASQNAKSFISYPDIPDHFTRPAGLKIDEPGGVVPLPVNPALSCPGFYVLAIGDGPNAGAISGSYGAELLLLSPGSRVLAGGLNFGGLMDASAPGYAAFTIANSANENQTVNINLTGFRPLSGNPNIRLRVTLERRLPTTQVVVSQVVTVGQNSPYVTSATVSPGFYVATVEPIDTLTGADGVFGMSLLSSFVNRPGGGFQGGVVLGGYHDPFASSVSGFAGFCLPDAHSVQIRTEGRPTRGPAGAGDLAIALGNSDGQIVYQNPTSSAVSGTIRIENYLGYPVAILANGSPFAVVPARTNGAYSYSGPTSVSVDWAVVRPVNVINQQLLGEPMIASFSTVSIANGQTVSFTIDNIIETTTYFLPIITNQTPTRLLMGINMGLSIENRCNCIVPSFGTSVGLGYYRLSSISNVRAYREENGYFGSYIYWGDGPSGTTTPLFQLMEPLSGAVRLTATQAP